MANAYAVHTRPAAIAEGNDVAVGRETLPQPVRDGEAGNARAQQDLRRSERSGGQDHHVRTDAQLAARAAGSTVEPIDVHAPPPVGRLGDVTHPGVSEDFGAV